jgi:DNA-binding transcriptional LysR family regulator
MRLTPSGERLLTWARTLLAEAEQARREVTGQGQTLRLGALETIAATEVPLVLAALAARRRGGARADRHRAAPPDRETAWLIARTPGVAARHSRRKMGRSDKLSARFAE